MSRDAVNQLPVGREPGHERSGLCVDEPQPAAARGVQDVDAILLPRGAAERQGVAREVHAGHQAREAVLEDLNTST